jgi:hypothetical protein
MHIYDHRRWVFRSGYIEIGEQLVTIDVPVREIGPYHDPVWCHALVPLKFVCHVVSLPRVEDARCGTVFGPAASERPCAVPHTSFAQGARYPHTTTGERRY